MEALVWLASEKPDIDIFHLLKVLYFADKEHLNQYGRPILGDAYFAMDDGPVPSLAYDIAERDERHLNAQLLEAASGALEYTPRTPNENYIRLRSRRRPNLKLFSRTDIRCLTKALHLYGDMPTGELWRLVHNEPSYVATYSESGPPQPIGYELLLDRNDPDFEGMLNDLQETAHETLI